MKLVIADDSALLREGIAGMLTRLGHEVVGTADDAPSFLATVRELWKSGQSVDVIIADVRMPPHMSDDGLSAALELRGECPEVGLLVLSQYVAPSYAARLFSAQSAAAAPAVRADGRLGGIGYLLKDRVSHIRDFLRSLDLIAAGGTVVDPEVTHALVKARDPGLASLTARESEVLELMARGLSNGQISEQLYLSGAAVAKHVANIFAKLGLPPGEDNRRVRAVLAYLSATRPQ